MVYVPCGKVMHRVVLNRKGQLGFLDHTKTQIRAEYVLHQLGDYRISGCVTFLMNWVFVVTDGSGMDLMGMPHLLQPFARQAMMRNYNRYKKMLDEANRIGT